MNYAEEQLEYALENELKAIKSKNKELVLTNERLLVEKDCLFKIKEKALEEMHEYRQANTTLGDFVQELEGKRDKLIEQNSRMEEKLIEYEKIINDLKEQMVNTDKYVKSCETYVKSEKENNERLEKEVEDLKEAVKTLANLL